MLPGEILPFSKVYPGNLDGTLPLEKPYDLRNGILGGNRDQHMNVVGLQMPFQSLTLLLGCEVLETWPKVFSQPPV